MTDGVVVWTVRQGDAEVDARLRDYESLLTPDEQQRAQRFWQEPDRARFIIGRALARTMLSRFADVSPDKWRIVIDEHGRPLLGERPATVPDLRFNLSHTDGLVACALTIGREVGVDVEHIDRRLTHDVPERFFSPHEVADLQATPARGAGCRVLRLLDAEGGVHQGTRSRSGAAARPILVFPET